MIRGIPGIQISRKQVARVGVMRNVSVVESIQFHKMLQ